MNGFGPATALVCIDMQKAILAGLGGGAQREVDAALDAMLARVAGLQAAARRFGVPVVHVQHDGDGDHRLARGKRGWELRPEVAPLGDEPVVHKRSCDAFFETDLHEVLERAGARRLVVAGCMTQFCVDTTCRRAVTMGYDVTLVGDGHMNAGWMGLSFEQVIAHHNAILDGFDAGPRTVTVTASAALRLDAAALSSRA